MVSSPLKAEWDSPGEMDNELGDALRRIQR